MRHSSGRDASPLRQFVALVWYGLAAGLLCASADNANGQNVVPSALAGDHAHHAIDAVAVANATPALVQPDANTSISWTLSPPPSPSLVTINVLDTVTWNGNFSSPAPTISDAEFIRR